MSNVRDIQGFGVGYGFIVDATSDGKITLNAKALAKIEPEGKDAIREMQRRANAYPKLVDAVLDLIETANDLLDCDTTSEAAIAEHAYAKKAVAEQLALLRDLGEE